MALSPDFLAADPRHGAAMRVVDDVPVEAAGPDVAPTIARSHGIRPVGWLLPELALDLHRSGDSRGYLEVGTRHFGASVVAELYNGFAVRGSISIIDPAWAAVIVRHAPRGTRLNGRLVRRGDVFAMAPGSGVVVTQPEGTRLGILVAAGEHTREVSIAGYGRGPDPLGTRAGPAHARRIVALYESLQSGYPARDSVAADRIRTVLADAAHHRSRHGEHRSRSGSSERIVADVLSYLDRETRWKVPLHELENVAGASDRRVQMAFRELLGVSPSRYMRARALQAVHDQLRDPDTRAAHITSIALDHGFEHLGRFSSYYREMFGERPSATLRERHPNAA